MILEKIFWILSQIKKSHWEESSGYRHEILGKFYSDLDELFDLLVETIQGGDGQNIEISNQLFVIENNVDYDDFFKEIYKFIDDIRSKYKDRSYIVNIVDDIDTLVNKNLYLIRKK